MTTPIANLSNLFMVPQALTACLETIINKVLALDSANVSLDKLAQKTLSVELVELGFVLSFTVTPASSDQKAKILVTSCNEHSDCCINTSVKTLRELKAEQQLTELIKQDKLDVTGDIKVAQQFAQLAENLNIDWASEIAKHIGDVPTHKLMQLGNKVSGKLAFAASQIQADASEYLVHEQGLIVSRSHIARFNQSVDEISKQVAELETRINRLTQR